MKKGEKYMFIDYAKIIIGSGKGGNGAITFIPPKRFQPLKAKNLAGNATTLTNSDLYTANPISAR